MRKKVLSILLTVCLLVGCLPMASVQAAGYNDPMLKYSTITDWNGAITRIQSAELLVATVEALSETDLEEGNNELTFTDIGNLTDQQKTVLKKAVNAGLVSGKPNNTFTPTANVTRAEFAQYCYVVLRSGNAPLPEGDMVPPDVTSAAWYYNTVKTLCALGIISTSRNFDPNGVSSCQEAYDMLTACVVCALNPAAGVPTTINLHYDENVGITVDGSATISRPEANLFDLTVPQATQSGYAFVGWNTKEDGTGLWYLPNHTARYWSDDVGIYHMRSSLRRYVDVSDLYAQWEQVSFDSYAVYWSDEPDTYGVTYEAVEIPNSGTNFTVKTSTELGFSKTSPSGDPMTVYEWCGEVGYTSAGSSTWRPFSPGTTIDKESNHSWYLTPTWGTRAITIHQTIDGEDVEETEIVRGDGTKILSGYQNTDSQIFLGYNTASDGTGTWYTPRIDPDYVEEDELWALFEDAPEDYVIFSDNMAGWSTSFKECPTHIVEKVDGGYTAPEFTTANIPGFHIFMGWQFELANWNDAAYDMFFSLRHLVMKDGSTQMDMQDATASYAPGTKITWLPKGTVLYPAYAMLTNGDGNIVPRIALHPGEGAAFALDGDTYWISNAMDEVDDAFGTTIFSWDEPILLDYDTTSTLYTGFSASTKLFKTVPTGKQLAGWNTEADGSGTQYTVGASVPTAAIGQFIHLYAQWEDTPPAPPAPSGGSSTPTTPDPVITENPDGSTTTTETAEDGTVTAITTWDDGKQAVSTVTSNGEVTITVKSGDGETMSNVNIPAVIPNTGKKYDDVHKGDWFEEDVYKATNLGLFAGTSSTGFSPKTNLNRGMLVTVLYRMSGEPGFGTDKNIFSDIAGDEWYADASNWAKAMSVAAGTGKGFEPKKDITRQDMVTLLYRYAKAIGLNPTESASLAKFTDGARTSGYAQPAMQWAVSVGIISGKGNGVLDPKGNATRAEVATVLTRFVEYLKK